MGVQRSQRTVRLLLAYNAQSNTFNGAVWNTTDKKLDSVRVEVHTSNGREIGPTVSVALKPGEVRLVVKSADRSGEWRTWGVHAEVGEEG